MPKILLLSILLFLSACSTPDLQASRDTNTKSKILANQSEATTAQNEYKQLQAQRGKV